MRDLECDIAIIGGGIAGLWCAYNLVNAGKSVCVLEANKVASGVTAGSTAIFTHAQDVIYHPLTKKHGTAVAEKYLHDSINAVSTINKIIHDNNADCDWTEIDFVLFSQTNKGKRALDKERKAYKKLGLDIPQPDNLDLPFTTTCALKFSNCHQCNPLKLCSWLAEYITQHGGEIFENTMVKNAPDGNNLAIGDHTVTAKHFIVATHFPYINAPGFYWTKIYQSQNYCMEIAPPADTDFCRGTSYESIDKSGFEYRRKGDNILVDGVGVRTGEKNNKSKYALLQKHLDTHFPGYTEVTRYCAQDCITMDGLPYAGKYSRFHDNVYVVTGFNKWGMTNAFITATVVTDIILGKPCDRNIYSPQRNMLLANPIEAIGNMAVIAASFARRLSPWAKKCPHMGCALKYNRDTKTWDCPCHGSRFAPDGKIINNPSTKCARCLGTPSA